MPATDGAGAPLVLLTLTVLAIAPVVLGLILGAALRRRRAELAPAPA